MKRKRNIVLSILSLIFLIILPLFVGVLSSWNYQTPTPSTLSNGSIWYVENENGEDYILDQNNDLDIEKNEIFKIYTIIENHDEKADTLYIYNQFQLIKVFVDNELIYTNDTSSNRFFGKAEERRIHLISLPTELDGKKITVEYSCPYKIYAGKIHGLIIASKEELFDKIIRNYVFPLTISMFFFCSTLALFLTSFFFLKEYQIFNQMNNLLCACLFLSVSFVCESKLLTLFFDIGHSNFTHLFLVLFNLFVLKFLLKEKNGKKEKIVPLILMILNSTHLIISCLLQLFNIIDLVETTPITLIIQNLTLIYYVFSKLLEFIKSPRIFKEDRIFLIETIFIALLLTSNIIVFNLDYTNSDLYLISGGIFIIYIYIRYSLSIRFIVNEARKSSKYESELKETKNYLINSQMKSHFVFNTLGAIRTMIVSHPKMAYEMTTDFTKYLRANISNTNSTDLIPFNQELEHIKAYLNIETKRFMNRLNVVYDIKTIDFSIPPLSVEPLVENAVKHGVCKKIKGGTVNIITKENNEYIYIIIEDDGVGFDVDTLEEAGKNGHVGLRYIKTRLKQLANADFEIISKVKEGTKATITIKK